LVAAPTARAAAVDMPSDHHQVTMSHRSMHIWDLCRSLQLGQRGEDRAPWF